ncbi:MAG: hypothetical protein GY754_02715 [bacterium]|nr:hypothetical protein [bacterium]
MTVDAYLAFPTGAVDAVDGDQNVPLGAGAMASYFSLALSQQISIVRLFVDGGVGFYWYNADYEVELSGTTTQYIIDKAPTYYGLVGIEFTFFKMFMLSGKINYVYNGESQVEEPTAVDPAPKTYPAGDYLVSSDLVFMVKFYIIEDLALYTSFLVPVYTKYSSSLSDSEVEARTWGMSVGVSTFL